ncbi:MULTISPECIES: SCO family protein [Mesonia]|uniref:SCO1 protein n=1 Tax=Mesonia oceanica TaxID=2687242 RepID=A0AC61Y4N5_9FLAO|nr:MULTISPECIES: SCO family protein [Mesonia]MAN28273.1 SCO family protein [Mesonia sp.]MAQ41470.1 SCO family protein [Mesonia sp.]VVU99007.1 SCO1 protein [Mesonia oceanica]|tara:strand:- start:15425 stop:16102 length:678 start_codon:yes stop_codon:yes gene_type:complete
MLKFFAKYKFFALVLFVLSAIIISIIYQLLKPAPTLPVYQPDMVNRELVDTTVQYVRKYHKIPDFKLVNQNGDTITQKDYQDKIYIADFFFTTCQSICPIMTDHMVKIQEEFKDDPEILLLSHTVTPEIDSVAQLKRYAEKKGVIDEKWNLVTGDKKEIYDLARKSYLVAKSQGNGGKYDMVHTENFALIDKQKQVRGFYDGTDPEAIEQLVKDVKLLKKLEKKD